MSHKQWHHGALISAGVMLGTGLGGFVDGILLHQILQWHNMLSSRLPPTDLVSMKVNMLWDGLFHAFTWLATVVGLGMLWRAGQRSDVPRSTRTLVGSLAIGWGAFNLVEGMIDHQLLGIHHVHPGEGQLAWDVSFLVLGALLVGAGWGLIRAGRSDMDTPRSQPLMILVAGPYRSGTNDDPVKMAANVTAMTDLALRLYRAGHLPVVGEWFALPLVEAAGSIKVGDAPFNEIFHPIAHRLLERCDACLRVGGDSQGADEMVRTAQAQGKQVFYRIEDVPGCG
jgi:uncharacterized membrane protein